MEKAEESQCMCRKVLNGNDEEIWKTNTWNVFGSRSVLKKVNTF